MSARRVAVTGATGEIGRPLCQALLQRGDLPIVLSRDPDRARASVPGAAGYLGWDASGRAGLDALTEVDAIVHLAGASIFRGRHSRAQVEAESEARVAALRRIEDRVRRSRRPPIVVAASSVGFYGYARRGDEPLDETKPAGRDWWGRGGETIEQAALAMSGAGARVVVVRAGYVLSPFSLASQVAQFRRHAGGWIGMGRGWVPWIHLRDAVGAFLAALDDDRLTGALNATAPQRVTSRTFAVTLGRVLGEPAWLPAPTPLVRLGMGVVVDILVKGGRIEPARLTAAGYRFRFPELEPALRDLVGATVEPVKMGGS